MNKMMYVATTSLLAAALAISSFAAQTGTAPATTTKATKAAKTPATPAPTAAEISDAKTKGMVWVNTSTKVYHTDGKFYGATKHGKFMTKEDADKAGFKAAQEPTAKKAKPAAAAAAK